MLTLLDIRNRHFISVVKRILDTLPANAPVDIETVAARAAMEPAPAYYCTYDYALRMLRVYRHGRLRLRRDRRFALWTELNAKVSRLMERRGVRLPDALADVLAGGRASQFFIAPATAASIARRYYDTKSRTMLLP